MTKEIEDKLEKIPIINILVRFGKKIKIPGLEGMSLYDVLEMYIIGIVEGALTTRAGGIAYSFFMAIFPFLLFVLTLIPYISIDGFQEGLMSLIAEVLPPKTFEASQLVIQDILVNQQAGLLSFGFLVSLSKKPIVIFFVLVDDVLPVKLDMVCVKPVYFLPGTGAYSTPASYGITG